jgi:pseudouridine synthase
MLRAKAVKSAGYCKFRVTVVEGKNREVRRMVRQLDGQVKHLLRVRFGPLELGEFRSGFWRDLSAEELQALRAGG